MPQPTLPSVRSTVPENSCSRIPMRVSDGSRRYSLSWLCGRPSIFFLYLFYFSLIFFSSVSFFNCVIVLSLTA
ncbi:hypothetical protein BDV40DRAFT_257801 [Aspergillus tamarii]|uniref:Uncharacterized protein n=1 Tax=Aspergillus tamarii TaxID=41984 RepID=A0A5N6V3K2_ASPTM|nr:hypothetical protein BDV40DRAFT_257801 [Aspergillus tamarii]